jgi:2-iminobutanoate/2-iminopropanoate deaminase
LEAADRTFPDVVRATVYLTNMADFVAVNSIYAKYFKAPYPASTTIAVAALPLGASVEIDVIAAAGGAR